MVHFAWVDSDTPRRSLNTLHSAAMWWGRWCQRYWWTRAFSVSDGDWAGAASGSDGGGAGASSGSDDDGAEADSGSDGGGALAAPGSEGGGTGASSGSDGNGEGAAPGIAMVVRQEHLPAAMVMGQGFQATKAKE